MDPNKALANLIDAVKESDYAGYAKALNALKKWDNNDGFMPTKLPSWIPRNA
jgi:hypothetical protein